MDAASATIVAGGQTQYKNTQMLIKILTTLIYQLQLNR
jgi:hypothetical protein